MTDENVAMLTDEQCDTLSARTMDAVGAAKNLHALEVNPDITVHATLRRALIRSGFDAARTLDAEIARLREA